MLLYSFETYEEVSREFGIILPEGLCIEVEVNIFDSLNECHGWYQVPTSSYPNGLISVDTGIETLDEVAGTLLHEIGHVMTDPKNELKDGEVLAWKWALTVAPEFKDLALKCLATYGEVI
jgi:hypothetical protein